MNKKSVDLLMMAIEASQKAYSPYSGYKVGAALMAKDGRVFTGCNVENSSYSVSNCAERTALYKAVSEGVREFTEIAVYVDSDAAFPPCGVCRQALLEFAPNLRVIYASRNNVDNPKITTLKKLLPDSFRL